MIVKYFLAKHGELVLGGWWAVREELLINSYLSNGLARSVIRSLI